eukprot:TRINITY_DN12994_c0_g1::TRINITY_DN12994_c0_g1_i1::g.11145::m.11145 TRINITY_DN12994_c0_g1::TRINITY_DN12994_c0_g1_i1::g.11145  ORF type:complete len:196 (+),score=48.60,sp/A4QVI3/DENR_MAGO7/40.59/1e-32,SUI1/PF01253.17/2.8e-19,K167R/PF08065.7/0.034,RNase_H2-Ydr279/PF09468.5/0.39 TRINITY_DN12994_c0_g1_i1:87-674(+)
MAEPEPVMDDEVNEVPLDDPVEVQYCGSCGLPPEYCEFGSDLPKCLPWLKEHRPDLYESFSKIEVTEATKAVEDLQVSEKPAETGEKPEGGEEEKEKKPKKKKEKSKEVNYVIVSRKERNKKKHVTTVQGLDLFGVKLKDAAKLFANKFSCGSSVVKDEAIGDHIDIQGDFVDEVSILIVENFKQIAPENIKQKL